jgi:hypothetical protein
VRRIGVREPANALPVAVEVVEAVVLLVDDHDVVDRPQLVRVAAPPGGGAAREHERRKRGRRHYDERRKAPKHAQTSSV